MQQTFIPCYLFINEIFPIYGTIQCIDKFDCNVVASCLGTFLQAVAA